MSLKLLIIDDEPIHHRLVELVVKYSGISIDLQSFIQAADAFSFLVDEKNADSLPDLILLDLNMAIISGWDFLDLFEAINSRLEKTVDIVILTSSIDPFDKAKALKYKCVKGYFSKPFTKEILEYIINPMLTSTNKDNDR